MTRKRTGPSLFSTGSGRPVDGRVGVFVHVFAALCTFGSVWNGTGPSGHGDVQALREVVAMAEVRSAELALRSLRNCGRHLPSNGGSIS